jgi:hypothetical protein
MRPLATQRPTTLATGKFAPGAGRRQKAQNPARLRHGPVMKITSGLSNRPSCYEQLIHEKNLLQYFFELISPVAKQVA